MKNCVIGKYPYKKDIQEKIISDGVAHLTFRVSGMDDLIHPYSVPGYEYLSGKLVGFLDTFRMLLPEKLPIVLEITGKQFADTEREMLDKTIWRHYGLILSEASRNLKKIKWRIFVYVILMILSSSLILLASDATNEVITNYAAVLFWFFGYRVFIHLILDYQPLYKDYQWYRRLSSLKLIFPDDTEQSVDAEQVSKETIHYAREMDVLVSKDRFVKQVLMEDTCVSLGCRVNAVEDVVLPSGVGDMEIISDEMAEYLMSALPFVNQKAVTKLTIEGKAFSEDEQNRISAAFRNYMAFMISEQEAERKSNKGTSIFFTIGLFISTMILLIFGKNAQLTVHEFILVAFWFFADYLLEFAILSRKKIKDQQRVLKKLADMDIIFT